MLNNKRKYFYIHSFIFLVLLSKINERIFEIKLYSIVIYYFRMIDYLIFDKKISINLEFF